MDDKNMKSTENYLDNLLNSMNGRPSESDDAADTPSKTDTSSQDDFLRKFEKELESDAYDEYISDFERDLENDAFSEKQTGIKDVQTPAPSESDATLEEVLSENEKNDSFKIPDEVPQQDDRAENNAAINELDSAMESFDDQLGDEEDDFILDEIPGDEIPHVESESDDNNTPEAVQQAKEPASSQEQEQTPADADETPLSDIGEPDLAGNAGEDLIDLLNNGGLADLGDMLSEDGKVSEDEGDSEFEKFAENEMEAKNQDSGNINNQDEQPAKEKKKGFFARILEALFKERGATEEPQKDNADDAKNQAEVLSEENQQILKELESQEASEKKEKKKKKPKKEKKQKPAKEPKPKKVKKPKEKKPKEVDNSPKLPKGPVILICVFVASLFAFVMICTSLLGNSVTIQNAKTAYNDAIAGIQENDTEAFSKYVEAYSELSGLSLKGENERMFEKVQILASVSEKYEAYESFKKNSNEDMALDSLVCAAGRCSVNTDNANDAGCTEALDAVKTIITDTLSSNYNMSYDEAVELYNAGSRNDYTLSIIEKLKELGLYDQK